MKKRERAEPGKHFHQSLARLAILHLSEHRVAAGPRDEQIDRFNHYFDCLDKFVESASGGSIFPECVECAAGNHQYCRVAGAPCDLKATHYPREGETVQITQRTATDGTEL